MLAAYSPHPGSDDSGIALLLDRVGARFGLAALSRLEARESHIPERASIRMPVAGVVSRSPQSGAEGGSSKPPRPVRLFAPPEPVEAVWVLPDDPPFRFTWRRRAHRVHRADGPERIAEEWWTAEGAAAEPRESGDAIRDYYRVEDEAGRRFWLFRAGLPGNPPPRWFLHGIFA
jgi:protein ImuB